MPLNYDRPLPNWRWITPSFLRQEWSDWYGAIRESDGRAAAVRVIYSGYDPDGRHLVDLEKQLGRLAQIGCPQIARVLDFGLDRRGRLEDLLWYAVECNLPLFSLEAYARTRPGKTECLRLLKSIAQALQRAARAGVSLRPEPYTVQVVDEEPRLLLNLDERRYQSIALCRGWVTPPPPPQLTPPEERRWKKSSAAGQYRLAGLASILLGHLRNPAVDEVLNRARNRRPELRFPSMKQMLTALRESLPIASTVPMKVEPLILAVESDDLDKVRQLLAEGADPNVRSGSTHVLELTDRDEISYALIEAGAWCDSLLTRLDWALDRNRPDILQWILDHGGDIYPSGIDLLRRAASAGKAEVVTVLQAAGADPNWASSYQNPLSAAIWEGQLPVVELLVRAGADVERNCRLHGMPPLVMSIYRNHPSLVPVLLKAGADPNRGVPLALAAKRGLVTTAECLLKAGADPYLRDADGLCAFDLADASLLELLSSRGLEPPETPEPDPGWDLLIAAESGQTDKVRELLQAGVPIEIRAQNTAPNAAQLSESKVPRQEMSENELERRIRNQESTVDLGWAPDPGLTPLMLASRAGQPQVVRELLKAGAQVNGRSTPRPWKMFPPFDSGLTPLLLAIDGCHCQVVDLLLAGGADPNLADDYSRSPLKLATNLNQRPIVAQLLAAGSSFPTDGYDLPSEHPEMSLWLLGQGVLPNHRAFVKICQTGNAPLVQACLATGSDPGWGHSLAAAAGGREESDALGVVEILLESGADLEALDFEGRTPLEAAIEKDYTRVVARLLKAGANPDQGYGAARDRPECMALLQAQGARPIQAPPDFWEPKPQFAREARSDSFRLQLREIAARLDATPQRHDTINGGFRFSLTKPVDVRRYQQELLPQDVFLFEGEPGSLIVLPGADSFQAVSAVGTCSMRPDQRAWEIVDWLRTLPAFILWGITEHSLTGRFLAPLPDPLWVASEFNRKCPNLLGRTRHKLQWLAEKIATGEFCLNWDDYVTTWPCSRGA